MDMLSWSRRAENSSEKATRDRIKPAALILPIWWRELARADFPTLGIPRSIIVVVWPECPDLCNSLTWLCKKLRNWKKKKRRKKSSFKFLSYKEERSADDSNRKKIVTCLTHSLLCEFTAYDRLFLSSK